MLPSIIIYGLVNSVNLALIALGFSLTFGISGVANFAYGGFYILSGFLVWMLLNYLKFPFILAIIVTIGVVGLFGFRYLLGHPFEGTGDTIIRGHCHLRPGGWNT